ncbi:MAG TPA: ImmA/IrrE family metallo-endopeptidase [Solirubrobacterales bacterium]|nr:ImmA/IrrE family metallo-endopeptidase [Solirubrobacterales bacterium]
MSTSTAGRASEQDETEVCPGLGPAVEVIDVGHDVGKEAERDAERLLRITDNIGVPVEPAGIANRLGVRVIETKLAEDTFGGLLIEPGDDPKIVLNRRYSLSRQRLTCAEELGTYLRRSVRNTRYARLDRRTGPSIEPDEPEDGYGQKFGACLLMPKVAVQAFAEIGLDDLELAVQFVVSREAMQLRLGSLGIDASELRAA